MRWGGWIVVVVSLVLPGTSLGQDIDAVLQKLKTDCEEQKAKSDQLKKDLAPRTLALPPLSSVPGRASRSVELAGRQKAELSEMLDATITQALTLISRAQSLPPAEKAETARQASNAVANGRLLVGAIERDLRVNLSDLEGRLAIVNQALKQGSAEGMQATWARAFGDEDGGGVFLTETARVPLDRLRVRQAEYDVRGQRFILYEGDRRWLAPRMDPDIVAVVSRCLYSAAREQAVAVSFGIDPVNNGRKADPTRDHEVVLFGCPYLEDTRLGEILIDADDLLGSLWYGKNRYRHGEHLTRTLGYHSLLQLTLDHPVNNDIVKNVPFLKREIDMRVWIRADPIAFRRARPESAHRLEPDQVSLKMFSETIRLASPHVFRGEVVGNPGADVFTGYFNKNFGRFVDTPLRGHPTRETVRPFRDLMEAAYVTGLVKWIKGNGGERQIPMDVSWTRTYTVAPVKTPLGVPIPPLKDVPKEIRGPIVVYNQFGPSRLIDADGRTLLVKYDQGGRMTEMVRVEGGIEVPGSSIRRVRR